MAKIDKQSVLYLRKPNTQYQCRDCSMFLAKPERCTIHGSQDLIRPIGSCGFFVKGHAMDGKPMGEVTTLESGYTESPEGFSCKRCANFLPETLDCKRVDAQSEGDDLGVIHRDACCNAWQAATNTPQSDMFGSGSILSGLKRVTRG